MALLNVTQLLPQPPACAGPLCTEASRPSARQSAATPRAMCRHGTMRIMFRISLKRQCAALGRAISAEESTLRFSKPRLNIAT
jgi:hypothetical protein